MRKSKRNEKLCEAIQQLINSGAESRYSIHKAAKVSWAIIDKFLNTKCIGKTSAAKLNDFINARKKDKEEDNIIESDKKGYVNNTASDPVIDPYVALINNLVNSEKFVSAINNLIGVKSLLSGGELSTKQSEACVDILNRSLEAAKTEIAHLILEV